MRVISATFSSQINKPLHSLRRVTGENFSRIKFVIRCQQEMMGWNLNKKHENFKAKPNGNLNRMQNIIIPNTKRSMQTVRVQRRRVNSNK